MARKREAHNNLSLSLRAAAALEKAQRTAHGGAVTVARAGVGPGRGGPAWPGGAARDASGRGHAGPGAKTAGAGFIASASRAAGTERLVEKSFAESATLLCATLTGDPAEGGDRTGSGWRQKERSFRLL